MGRRTTRRGPLVKFIKEYWSVGLGSLIVAGLGLILAYKQYGAEELRAQLYQPLHAEVEGIERALGSPGEGGSISDAVFRRLSEQGTIARLPPSLRERLVGVVERARTVSAAGYSVERLVGREVSSRLMSIRSENSDKDWIAHAADIIRGTYRSQKGARDGYAFTLRHSGRGRAFDTRTNEPAGPGGQIVTVADWLDFPHSVEQLAADWIDFDFVYFSPSDDSWYFRLTKDDLPKVGGSLEAFMRPVHEVLKNDLYFKTLLRDRPALLREVSELKASLKDRVDSPKQVLDLLG